MQSPERRRTYRLFYPIQHKRWLPFIRCLFAIGHNGSLKSPIIRTYPPSDRLAVELISNTQAIRNLYYSCYSMLTSSYTKSVIDIVLIRKVFATILPIVLRASVCSIKYDHRRISLDFSLSYLTHVQPHNSKKIFLQPLL